MHFPYNKACCEGMLSLAVFFFNKGGRFGVSLFNNYNSKTLYFNHMLWKPTLVYLRMFKENRHLVLLRGHLKRKVHLHMYYIGIYRKLSFSALQSRLKKYISLKFKLQ